VLRVLKPGGRLLFIEHVAAPQGSWLRRIQNPLTPLWKQLGDGCHPNREAWVEVERAGFETVDYDRITAPTFIVSPQIVGTAIKAVSPNNMGLGQGAAANSGQSFRADRTRTPR